MAITPKRLTEADISSAITVHANATVHNPVDRAASNAAQAQRV